MDFAWFRDLGRLARTGSFSRAAELGHVSQPAFSRRIRAIEGWVGTSLVDRRSRPVALTGAGARMLEAGLEALERLEHERSRVREAESLPNRRAVTFGMPHSIAWRFYPDWLRTVEERLGPVATRMRADDLPSCVDALDGGDVDFVLAYESRFAPGIASRPTLESVAVGADALVAVCAADACGRPAFAADAPGGGATVPWLRFGAAASITRHLAPLLDELGIGERLEVVYENSMVEALRLRARDGAGVAWLPRSLVAADIEAGSLAATGGAAWELDLTIRLYRLGGPGPSPARDVWTVLADGSRRAAS